MYAELSLKPQEAQMPEPGPSIPLILQWEADGLLSDDSTASNGGGGIFGC